MRPLLFYTTAVFIVVCDQVSKWAVVSRLPYGAREPVLGKFLYLTHTHNTGGAFSLLQAHNYWFVLIAGIAVFALAYAFHRSARRDLWVSAALALALGGAIGNLIDRVRFGYVVDFFDVQFWPVFNVADSAISVGIVILTFTFLFKREPAPVTADGRPTTELASTEAAGVDSNERLPASDSEAAPTSALSPHSESTPNA